MGLGGGYNRYLGLLQTPMPDVHVIWRRDCKPNMIENPASSRRSAMQGKIVLAAREIDVIWIGAPHNGKPEQPTIKVLARLQIRTDQGDMTQA